MSATATCPVCRMSGAFQEFERREPYVILECPRCELGLSDPMAYRPDMYQSAYATGSEAGGVDYREYLETSSALTSRSAALRIAFLRWLVLSPAQRAALAWLLKDARRGSRVLDVGFGPGMFLAALRAHRFDACGLDVAGAPCERLRGLGYEVYAGSVADYPKHRPPPAVVTFFEVLEHLDDPVGFLRGIAAAFPGAPIIFSVPSPRRASLLRGREEWDYPPHHLTRWSEKAIGIALESAGYHPLGVRFPPPTPADFTGSGMGILLGVGCQMPGAAATSRRSASSELSRMAAVWLGKAVLFSPLIILRRLQGFSATSMVVMARPGTT